jgi:hypothetical protein
MGADEVSTENIFEATFANTEKVADSEVTEKAPTVEGGEGGEEVGESKAATVDTTVAVATTERITTAGVAITTIKTSDDTSATALLSIDSTPAVSDSQHTSASANSGGATAAASNSNSNSSASYSNSTSSPPANVRDCPIV